MTFSCDCSLGGMAEGGRTRERCGEKLFTCRASEATSPSGTVGEEAKQGWEEANVCFVEEK